MPEHISFFDAIETNKRNSILLIALIFFIFIAAIAAISYAYRLGCCGPVAGFFFLLIYTVIVFFSGDKVILAISHAKEVKREDYPFLYDTVEGLALAEQIPVPKIYVIDDPAPNAFATGRDPAHSSLAVTSGLLSMMKREELEGVIAHEISHIANYDIRFSMIAIVFVGALGLLSEFALYTLQFSILSGGGRRDRRRGGGEGIFALLAIVFVILSPIFAEFVRMALSRQREYLADANGARITRYPEGLASALEKIKAASIPTHAASDMTASLFFSNPFPNRFSFLGSTHPPIDDRIKRLRSM